MGTSSWKVPYPELNPTGKYCGTAVTARQGSPRQGPRPPFPAQKPIQGTGIMRL